MTTTDSPTRCDLIIRNGQVIDGTGRDRFRADIAVDGDRITAIGDLARTEGVKDFDAGGKIVSPGFIDVHTHDDGALLTLPGMEAKLSQGVTSIVVGNCGFSLAPLTPRKPLPQEFRYLGEESGYRFGAVGDYVEALRQAPPAVNAALLIGHSTLRVGTMADIERPASDGEIAAMRARLREGLEAGAVGFSTGLDYPPNAAATTDEVVAVAEELRPFGGLYVTHTRDYVIDIDAAMEEALQVGRRAGVGVVLSHHQGDGPANHGHSHRTLGLIDRARRQQTVGLDAYPYIAGASTILAGYAEISDPVTITWSDPHPELVGRDLREIAMLWGCGVTEACERLKPGGAIYYSLDESDVQRILAYPHTMIGSDSLPHERVVHPRVWGTFPRVLGRYARELGLFSMEEAIRKMTSLPARQFGFAERGALRPNAVADLVVFDPERVIDRATFERPDLPSEGIDFVVVNGVPAWREGRPTGERAGRVLRRTAF